jgi:hypothetical protein
MCCIYSARQLIKLCDLQDCGQKVVAVRSSDVVRTERLQQLPRITLDAQVIFCNMSTSGT